MGHCLAVDGGGTKTDMAFVDHEGHVLGHCRGPGCNPTRTSDQTLQNAIAEIVAVAEEESPQLLADTSLVLAGIAGGSHPGNNTRLRAAFGAAVPAARSIQIVSDTVSALWSGTFGKPGIALIAGTGATAYGEDAQGGGHRAGGWGYLIGDDGSGYALGREAMRSVCRCFDGTGRPTRLWQKLAERYGLAEAIDIVPFVYGRNRPPFDELVPLVLEAYLEGDESAAEAVHRTVDDQVSLIVAVRDRLAFGDNPFTLVLRGGLVQRDNVVRDLLVRRLREQTGVINFSLDTIQARPVVGSAALALKASESLTPHTLESLIAESRQLGLISGEPGAEEA